MVHGTVSALRVAGLCKSFRKHGGEVVHALKDLDLDIGIGECVAVIGESGSGKSTLARILMGLEVPDRGTIEVGGGAPGNAARASVDGGIAVVLQDPADALDPRFKTFAAISEPLVTGRRRLSKAEVRHRVLEAMASVSLPETLADSRVSRLSGGQQQRVGIARALVMRPSLLILDEPTSALDPSVQAQILDLLENLQRSENLSVLLITHDLAVAAYLGDRICVLRHGTVVEIGGAMDVWRRASHPYTRALMSASAFTADRAPSSDGATKVAVHPGSREMSRCGFADVCGAERATACAGHVDHLSEVGPDHLALSSCITRIPVHTTNEERSV